MANPTTNYGWPMPTTTDLVTDLPADFAAFGQPVDTSLKALNPETTLGDIAYRSSTSNTNTRLGIGSTGNVLTVASGVPSWAAPAAASSMTELASGNLPTGAASVSLTGISGTYEDLYVVINGYKPPATFESSIGIRLNNDSGSNYYQMTETNYSGTAQFLTTTLVKMNDTQQNAKADANNDQSFYSLLVQDYANSTTDKFISGTMIYYDQANNYRFGTTACRYDSITTITRLDIVNSNAYNFGGGTYAIYGVK
jgi:hypothetical protein